MKFIDKFLNSITMYRLLLYGLICGALLSLVFGITDLLPFPPFALAESAIILTAVCFFSNLILSKFFRAPINIESSFVTALILFFILYPAETFSDVTTLIVAGFIAMLSKFVVTVNKKHIFNPAIFAAVVLGLIGSASVFWWAGSGILLPYFAVFGFLILRKIHRFSLFFSFLITSLSAIQIFGFIGKLDPVDTLITSFVSFPLIFFGSVMLAEPLTTPPAKKLQIIYGTIVGFLFGSQFHFGPVFSTPELALAIGNIYSFIVSPKYKLFLKLRNKNQIAKNTFEFVFEKAKDFNFLPGQYMEWTLPEILTDGRGNRRYFTIASSPTEEEIKLGARFNGHPSSFKKQLSNLEIGKTIVASQLSGEFIMPADKNKKLVFIAGGIGITPIRSMIKYLIDKGEKRDIVLFYACKSEDEIAYKNIIEQAEKNTGLKIFYLLNQLPTRNAGIQSTKVISGRLNAEVIKEKVTDFMERKFYLSGPDLMVRGYKQLLLDMGVNRANIVIDYFPGY